MSLVIEALRRVEKAEARPGSVGAFVTSYRPAPKGRGSAAPLLLGLLTGGTLVFLFGGRSQNTAAPDGQSPDSRLVSTTPHLKGAAGLPPPMIIESSLRPAEAASPSPSALAKAEKREGAPPVTTPKTSLVLQAISERDSHPIAIINDQLVRVGERIGSAKVVHIGPDFVEVILDNGGRETVRFAPPPPPTPEAQPTPTPHF